MESHVITLDGKKIDLENEIEEIELDEEEASSMTAEAMPLKVSSTIPSPKKERTPLKRKAVARKRVSISSLSTYQRNVTGKIDDPKIPLDLEDDDTWASPENYSDQINEPPDKRSAHMFNRLHEEHNVPSKSYEPGRRASLGAVRPPKSLLAPSVGGQRRKSTGDATPPLDTSPTDNLDLTELYSRLQVLLPKGDSTRRLWPRVLILERAKEFIRALRKGDMELELATEVLMQENFRLQYRVSSLQKSGVPPEASSSGVAET